MASADQIKALLKSHLEGDEERFYSVAIQLAAHEARLGHGQLAEDLRALVDEAKKRRGPGWESENPIPISRPRGELAGLLAVSYPKSRLKDLVLNEALVRQLTRVIQEQRHAVRILEHGLSPRRKLLLVGPPGTGKTLTAAVLAGELGIPLFLVRLDGLITKFMGETAAKLAQVFEATENTRGVYFFDEFDAIGSQRDLTNDVGEIRRILNSFLLMIEQDRSHSLIVAATNHPNLLDRALYRRFDDVLRYSLPDSNQAQALLQARLLHCAEKGMPWAHLAAVAEGLSHADIVRAASEALKDALIHERQVVLKADVVRMLDERKAIATGQG